MRRAVSLLLLAVLCVLGAIVPTHAHDTSAVGLYDRQCPMQDATGRLAAVSVMTPAPGPLAYAGVVATLSAPRAAVAFVSPAPSRAPPPSA